MHQPIAMCEFQLNQAIKKKKTWHLRGNWNFEYLLDFWWHYWLILRCDTDIIVINKKGVFVPFEIDIENFTDEIIWHLGYALK